jgi:hypothetical protein
VPHEGLGTAEAYNSTEMTLTLHTSLLSLLRVGSPLSWGGWIENLIGSVAQRNCSKNTRQYRNFPEMQNPCCHYETVSDGQKMSPKIKVGERC